MRTEIVRDLIRHTGSQRYIRIARDFSGHIAFNTKQDVPQLAPVIGEVVFGVVYQPDTQITVVNGPPAGLARFTRMYFFRLRIPVGGLKGNGIHGYCSFVNCAFQNVLS